MSNKVIKFRNVPIILSLTFMNGFSLAVPLSIREMNRLAITQNTVGSISSSVILICPSTQLHSR